MFRIAHRGPLADLGVGCWIDSIRRLGVIRMDVQFRETLSKRGPNCDIHSIVATFAAVIPRVRAIVNVFGAVDTVFGAVPAFLRAVVVVACVTGLSRYPLLRWGVLHLLQGHLR